MQGQAITAAKIENWFEYHAPDAEQQEKLKKFRAAAKEFASIMLEVTDPCPDQTAAMRKLREVTMTVNAAIILRGE